MKRIYHITACFFDISLNQSLNMKKNIYVLVRVMLIIMAATSVKGQILSEREILNIEKNATDISVDEQYRHGNWQSLIEKVKHKRIVLVGELNHGSKENFKVRNDLIQSLHERAGFDVILFEAGLGEVHVVDLLKTKLSSEVKTYSLMSQWQNKAFSDLFSYAQSENMAVGGFDIQRGFGGFFDGIFEEACRKHGIDSMAYQNLEKEFVNQKKILANSNSEYEEVYPEANRLLTSYQAIYEVLEAANPSTTQAHFVLKTIENRIDYLTYMLAFANDKNWSKRWAARDLGMAKNVKWLLDDVFKDEKVIIVAHNFHIAKHNEQEEVMGEYLKEDFDTEMYSIGTFIGTGHYWQSGQPKEIVPVDRESPDIKHIIQALDGRVHFMDISNEAPSRDAWMDKKILVNDSFINLSGGNELILSKWFDGIILIDKSTIPEKHH